MKVLHIIPTLSKGGAEKVVVDLINESHEKLVDVKLLLFFPSDPKLRLFEINKNIEVLYITDSKSNPFWLLMKSVFWMINHWRFLMNQNILHAHLTISSIFISVFKFFCFATLSRGPILIETNHAIGIPIKKWQHNLFQFNSRFRDAYVLIGEDAFWELLIEKRKNVGLSIIKNGIKINNRNVDFKEREKFLNKIGITNPETFIIGTVSRIVPERSPARMVEIFRKIHLKIPNNENIHFVFGGDGALLDLLKKEVDELKMKDLIHFPGLVEDATLARSVMSIYISINIGDVTGIAGIEAASEGLPVISLQMDSSYVNSDADWIWSSSDTDMVADAVVKLVNNEELRFQIGQNQQNYVIQNLNSNLMTKSYIDLYSSLLN